MPLTTQDIRNLPCVLSVKDFVALTFPDGELVQVRLQGTNISHLGQRKHIDSKVPLFKGDLLVPIRVYKI